MKWALPALMLLSGCCWTDKTGTQHTLVLGVGVLSVRQTNSILVYKQQVLGVGAGNLPAPSLTAGYSSSVGVTAGTNALVEVSQRPFSPIIITQP